LINPCAGAINPESESETGELLCIDIRCAQHVRVHHARSAKFDPTRPFADATACASAIEATVIDFSARLSEWKVRGTKARLCLRPEQAMNKFRQRAFQMRHRDSAIDAQAFHLKEHRIVRRIGSISAKDSARRNHAHGGAPALHRVNLYRRSLRAQCET